jgi:tetratricopeptide (TPR) repeat protein
MCLRKLDKKLTLASFLIGLACCWGVLFALGQEVQYTTAEYNAYQQAVAGGEDTIIEFIKAHPDSALKEYAVGAYQQLVKDYLDKGEQKKAAGAAEKYLKSVDGQSFQMAYIAAWSSFYSQQYKKAAVNAEKAFALKPDAPELKELVPVLARSYLNLGNHAKSLPHAEKYCATVSPKDCYDLLPGIMRHYAEKKSFAKASKYADLKIKAFDTVKRPAHVSETEWNKFANEEKSVGYAILGRHAAESRKWRTAEKNYIASRQLGPRNRARNAEGYFYIGMSRWNRELIDGAMQSFAKGSLLKGTPHSAPCRRELERLYKATHNGSLAGLEEYLDNAASW